MFKDFSLIYLLVTVPFRILGFVVGTMVRILKRAYSAYLNEYYLAKKGD